MYKRLEIFIAALLYYSGLVYIVCIWKRRKKSLVILNYHRAAHKKLRQHLIYLHRYYRIMHLEDALEELYSHKNGDTSKKDTRTPLVITLDDGYHDNYTDAFRLACELHIPLTIFLIPGYIGSGKYFWWDAEKYLHLYAKERDIAIGEHTYHRDNEIEQRVLKQIISTRIRHASSVAEREAFLHTMVKTLPLSEQITIEDSGTLPLTWDEVREMDKSEWVSFGTHTMHHPILAYLSDSIEVAYEVKACKETLEQRLEHPVHTFAYPVGKPEHIGEIACQAVQNAGYHYAVTTTEGFNDQQSNPYLLRRLDVAADQPWLLIAAKTSGVWGFFLHIYRIPASLIKGVIRLLSYFHS
jgi:peptidoglycan/xylan/chitin deacetylase (PgdA/CDA1 family)